MADLVIVEAALNGSRARYEHSGVPLSATELAVEARLCVEAGASVVHVHARNRGGGWTARQAEYERIVAKIRAAAPGVMISITSLRPQGVPVERVQGLLEQWPPGACPELISVNLGHITAWEARQDVQGRDTHHFPNSYDDIVQLLETCHAAGVMPEYGVMDFGFISNAVTLRNDGALLPAPWFLLELDSPAFGAGSQVAPATRSNYAALSAALREQFPGAAWAAHGAGPATYAVVQCALEEGSHVRVGYEDCVQMPDGTLASSNAAQVAWAVRQAAVLGRRPATPGEARLVIGGST